MYDMVLISALTVFVLGGCSQSGPNLNSQAASETNGVDDINWPQDQDHPPFSGIEERKNCEEEKETLFQLSTWPRLGEIIETAAGRVSVESEIEVDRETLHGVYNGIWLDRNRTVTVKVQYSPVEHTYISTDFPNLLVVRQHFYASGSMFQATVPAEPAGSDEGFEADFALQSSHISTSIDSVLRV